MPFSRTSPTRSLGAVGLSLTLFSAACSGGSSPELSAPATTAVNADLATATTAPATTTEAPATSSTSSAMADGAQASASMIPSALVTDVATGDSVDFASIAPADTPILLWMWAPH